MNQSPLNRFPDSGDLRSSIDRNRDLALILALGGILVAILVPLPGAVMDTLLGVNIAVSVLILLTVVYLRGPLEFAAFPSMLLIATLYRLALNIATTRLVLSKAQDEGSMAAGKVVNFFGEFVSGSNAVVGFIIFSVLVVIQFLVVTKGASRIAEVAARFSLDRMPGAQMSIDADLTAGNISASEARLAREDLALKADFYGAMDGASKFVRGDAIAAVLITTINIMGGICLGVFSYGMGFTESLQVFAKLTIGDGIATQLPALFISVAAALMVTRASSQGQVGHVLVGQVFANPRALFITAVILILLGSFGLSPVALGGLAVCLLAVA
ncbi:MAG: FHIPEP family type III secretion protein, partial [Planctomycetota bacterium]